MRTVLRAMGFAGIVLLAGILEANKATAHEAVLVAGSPGDVTAVLPLGDEILIGTSTGAVLEAVGQRFESVRYCSNRSDNSVVASDRVVSLRVDDAGVIWAVGWRSMRWRMPTSDCWRDADGRWGEIRDSRTLGGQMLVRSALGDGFALTATHEELIETRVSWVEPPGVRVPGELVETVVPVDGGGLLAGITDTSIVVVEADSGDVRERVELSGVGTIFDVAVDDDGNWWVATQTGLLRLRYRTAQEPVTARLVEPPKVEGLPSNLLTRWTAADDSENSSRFAIDQGFDTEGILELQGTEWRWLLRDAASYEAMLVDPDRPEMLWVGTTNGLLLVDTTSDGVGGVCGGPTAGCSTFGVGDGLPSGEVEELGLSVDGRVLVETVAGSVELRPDSGTPPVIRRILLNGEECEQCLIDGVVPWRSDDVAVTVQATDLGDWTGIETEIFVDGIVCTGQPCVLDLDDVETLRFEAVDRNHNRSTPLELEVQARPLSSWLLDPRVVAPLVLLAALVGLAIRRRMGDERGVRTATLQVTPAPSRVDLRLDMPWFLDGLRPRRASSQTAELALAGNHDGDRLAAAIGGEALAALVRRGKDRTTRLLVQMVEPRDPATSKTDIANAHNLGWERMPLTDDGLVPIRLVGELTAPAERATNHKLKLLMTQPAAGGKGAGGPLTPLAAVSDDYALDETRALMVTVDSLATHADLDAQLAAQDWDIVRIHAHGSPTSIDAPEALPSAALSFGPQPLLLLVMSCLAGTPQERVEDDWGDDTYIRGFVHELVAGGQVPMAIGFDTQVANANIAKFERALLAEIGNGARQLDVAVRRARRFIDESDDRFSLRVYTSNPSLQLFERI